MTRFIPLVFSLGLAVVACEKTKTGDVSQDVPLRQTRPAIRERAPRRPVPDTPEALRASLREAGKIDSPSMREKALAEVSWNAMEIDPGVAAEAFQQLSPNGTERIRLIRHHAMQLAGQDPEQAIEWADTMETAEEASVAYGHIALTLAETDPQRAANLLSESGISGHDFDVTVVQVIHRWAAKSAPDAADWVTKFPPGAAREAGIRLIAERWLLRDPAAAFGWLDSIRDQAIRQETARAMEGVILQQQAEIRDNLLQHATEKIRGELDRQKRQALLEVGDNVPAE